MVVAVLEFGPFVQVPSNRPAGSRHNSEVALGTGLAGCLVVHLLRRLYSATP
jgi:hypothetical protein